MTLPAPPAEVLTFGCRLNTLESERIRALAPPGTIVVNTCAVTDTAERDARHAIARLHRAHPGTPITVTGCAAQINPARWAALPGVSRVLGNAEKLHPDHWRPGAPSAAAPLHALSTHTPVPVHGLQARARAFLDVQQGCDHRCTFCIIPQGRGPGRSVPVEDAVHQVRHLLAHGTQEVVLTGVDLASWSQDGATLATLLRAILGAVPELPRLRLSSLDPAALDEPFWHLFATEPRLMPHLHLSLQAGSDLVLRRMRRRHSRAEALAAIRRARTLRPGCGIGADLIAGFPTESDALFAETLAMVEDAAIPYLHVFPYSARAGTPAARMPQVAPPLRRARAALLRAAGSRHAAAFHAAMVGRTVQVVAERGNRGHTEHFAPARGLHAEPGTLHTCTVLRADAAGLEVA